MKYVQARENIFKLGTEAFSGPNYYLYHSYAPPSFQSCFNLHDSGIKLSPDQSVMSVFDVPALFVETHQFPSSGFPPGQH